MDEYRENVKKVQKALNQDAAFIQPNPYLAQRVLNATNKKGGYIRMKKRTVLIILVLMMLLSSLTAFAAALLVGHDVMLYEGVDVIDLLPDQMQEYDICHRISQGYLIGGFNLGDDYIAPMDENDSIICLDENFQVKWTLTDPRLEGCLFDKVVETTDAIYFGLESSENGWGPAAMKVGLNGVVEWFYTGNSKIKPNDFVVDSHGATICVGNTEVEGVQKACILMIDSTGATKEEIILSELSIHSLSAVMVDGDKMILAGYGDSLVWIGEMNEAGDIVWQESIKVDEQVQTLRLQKNNEGSTIMSLEYEEPGNGEASRHMQYYVVER